MPRILFVFSALICFFAGALPGTDPVARPLSPDADPSRSESTAPGASWSSIVQERMGVESRRFRERDGRFTASVGTVSAERSADRLTAARGDDEIGLSFDSWGRPGAERPVAPVDPLWGDCASGGQARADGQCLRRIELPYEGITEHWETHRRSLAQGFEVETRPDGDGPLVLHLGVSGLSWEVGANGARASLVGSSGQSWDYEGLEVRDARGGPLEARLESEERGLALFVADGGAVYPLSIAPLTISSPLEEETELTTPNPQADAVFGWSVAGVGDVDNDGHDDVLVGATGQSGSEGAAYLYLGSSSGLDASADQELRPAVSLSFQGYGIVSGAGDVNGDGYDDVIVGTTGSDLAYVYYGSSTGLDTGSELLLTSDTPGGGFGYSVSSAGDVNRDGYADVIVGEWVASDGRGAAYVFHGASSGLESVPAVRLSRDGAEEYEYFGEVVSSAGDVDGDGYDDVIVGAKYAPGTTTASDGSAYVYMGSSTGIDATTPVQLPGEQEFSYTGSSVSGAGDVDGDGYDDVLVGAEEADGAEYRQGLVYVYYGSATGPDVGSRLTLEASSPEEASRYGFAVSDAGDVDGDGYADVLVGAKMVSGDSVAEGAVLVYFGSSTGLDVGSEQVLSGDAEGDLFGHAVSGAGDIDGDGYDDVVVGALGRDADGNADQGAAYVYLGQNRGGDGSQEVRGKSFSARDGSGGNDPQARQLRFQAREPDSSNAIVGNPALDGAKLEVIANGTNATVQTFDLPASGWRERDGGSRFTYRDPKGANGAVKRAHIRRSDGGKFSLGAAIDGSKGTVDVVPPDEGTDAYAVLKIGGGGDRYCVQFGADGRVRNKGAVSFRVVNPTAKGCP